MHREGCARRTFRLGIVVLSLQFAANPMFGQDTKAPVPDSASLRAMPSEGSRALGESRSEALLQAQLRAQQLEIELLKDRINGLEATVGALKSGNSNQRTGAVPGASPTATYQTAEYRTTEYAAAEALPGEPGAAPAPPAPVTHSPYEPPRELLPDIGQIGAEIGFFAGGATNPYKDNTGFATGGFIDLPFKKGPGGKLSYEIMIGLQRSVTTQTTTSGVNVLVDTALNSYLGNTAANGTSATSFLTGPLPITSTVQERSKVLTVAPFELKYAFTNVGARFRPYVVGGLGMYVWIGSDNNTQTFNANTALGGLASVPVGSSTLGATLNAILQGSQIGGLVPTAPQLAERGVPHGQGDVLFGGQIGGGFEIRVMPKLSLGADFRHNFVEGTNAGFNTFAFKQGLHW